MTRFQFRAAFIGLLAWLMCVNVYGVVRLRAALEVPSGGGPVEDDLAMNEPSEIDPIKDATTKDDSGKEDPVEDDPGGAESLSGSVLVVVIHTTDLAKYRPGLIASELSDLARTPQLVGGTLYFVDRTGARWDTEYRESGSGFTTTQWREALSAALAARQKLVSRIKAKAFRTVFIWFSSENPDNSRSRGPTLSQVPHSALYWIGDVRQKQSDALAKIFGKSGYTHLGANPDGLAENVRLLLTIPR